MIVIALMVAQVASPPPIIVSPSSTMTDAEFCSTLSSLSNKLIDELPKMIDSATRLDGMVTLCALRTVAWNKTILAKMSDMHEGWQTRKQSQWSDGICANWLYRSMARKGWTYVQNLTFLSGERVTLRADCR